MTTDDDAVAGAMEDGRRRMRRERFADVWLALRLLTVGVAVVALLVWLCSC